MQFTKVDEDAYTVLVNLDTIRRIGESMSYVDEDTARFDGVDERNLTIGTGFKNAFAKLSQSETPDESVETSE